MFKYSEPTVTGGRLNVSDPYLILNNTSLDSGKTSMSFEIGESVIDSNSNYCLEVKDYNCTGNDPSICLINSTKQWAVVSKIIKLDNGKGIFNVGEIEPTDLILLQFNCNDESVDEGTLTINKNIVLYKQ